MLKVIFPLIFILALELVPVVKTYADIKTKYGENLTNLTPNVQIAENSLKSALSDKYDQLEKSLGMAKEAHPNYWF